MTVDQEKLESSTKGEVNPYIENILGKWFKNIVTLILIIILGIIILFSLIFGWIDKELSLQIGFMILGSILGAWLSNDKK